MSKNYDLYPKSERKIDNWRRRILGYEKMKRDLQRQIQILKNKNKKQKEVIDKAIKYIECNKYTIKHYEPYGTPTGLSNYETYNIKGYHQLLDILKEVSE